MLTLKHVLDTGESLFQGAEVTYHSGGQDPNSTMAATEQVMYLDGHEWKSLRSGVVYVMNDTGKTVATYDMQVTGNAGAFAPLTPRERASFRTAA